MTRIGLGPTGGPATQEEGDGWEPLWTVLNPRLSMHQFRHERPNFRGWYRYTPTADGWFKVEIKDADK